MGTMKLSEKKTYTQGFGINKKTVVPPKKALTGKRYIPELPKQSQGSATKR